MLLDKKIDDLSENLNPIKIYKISEEDLEQGKKPEFDNFIDIMFNLLNPLMTKEQMHPISEIKITYKI